MSTPSIAPGDPVNIVVEGKTLGAKFIAWNFKTGAARVNLAGKEIERTLRDKEGKPIRIQKIGAAPGKKEINHFTVAERFQFLEDFTEMTLNGENNALVVGGEGGLGKTFTIMKTAAKLGLKEREIDDEGKYGSGDYVMIKGSSTAKAVYNSLWTHRTSTVIYDDCDSAIKDANAVNILKGALDSNGKRIISWLVDIVKNPEIPMHFEFMGKVIFLTNLPIKRLPQPLISRAMYVDVSMTQKEKFERMRMIAPMIDNGVESALKYELIDYLETLHFPLNDLNMRTFNKCCMLVRRFDDWKNRVRYLVVSI